MLAVALATPVALPLALWSFARLTWIALPDSFGAQAFLSICVLMCVFVVPVFIWLSIGRRPLYLFPLLGALVT